MSCDIARRDRSSLPWQITKLGIGGPIISEYEQVTYCWEIMSMWGLVKIMGPLGSVL